MSHDGLEIWIVAFTRDGLLNGAGVEVFSDYEAALNCQRHWLAKDYMVEFSRSRLNGSFK